MSESRTRAAVEVRMLIEPVLGRLAAQHRPPEALARMRTAIDEESAATDPWMAYEASREFHLALADASENEFFQRLADQLWSADLGRPLYQAYVTLAGSDWIHGDAAEHRAIFDAVAAGDADGAEAAISQHLGSAHDYMGAVIAVTVPAGQTPMGA
jgi:DNA-binding FadR family transcriptional regulator